MASADSYIGEIIMFAGVYAPRHWAFCDGQLLNVSEYQALFSLLGTTYGGNGQTTFALPDLRGRIPIHQGSGQGLTPRLMGQSFGQEKVVLTTSQIPAHTHTIQASSSMPNTTNPASAVLASHSDGFFKGTPGQLIDFPSNTVEATGNNEGHNNLMPTLCVSFIICVQGIFPSRN